MKRSRTHSADSTFRKISFRGRPLIVGTFILTATGLITRTIGFFYRIYLSRLFGEEGMGIYQLLSPVVALSFSLCAAAYQTAISKFVAEYAGRRNKRFQPLTVGLMISVPLSLLCCALICTQAEFIAVRLLLEPRTESMLRILAFSIPFSSIHACINGYFYGVKKTGPPALAQLLEQLARVGCVGLVSASAIAAGRTPSINVAVFGLAVGEFVSMSVALVAIFRVLYDTPARERHMLSPGRLGNSGNLVMFRSVLGMALPLTLNRIVLNVLQSVESVSIPARLRLYGYDNATALSVYGVLTGMAMPLIFFPNALTNSVSVLLLPLISENYAMGDMRAVKSAILRTIKFCAVLGLFCMSSFFLLGDYIGSTLFDSALAGHFITTLSFLCPFLYLDATLSSILQGLGKVGTIFVMNVISLLLRLAFVFGAIPRFGITGYLWGILTGQIVLSLLYLLCLRRFLRRHTDAALVRGSK
ncbi:MAG: polysaccharide biosynthesis protein [Clostridium sp.]|nr:polysaccharide biosynthesis protein [Acetatifactor muris]MCM1526072.1 polysaccharide biosynthesis protein [Bacteroides sp.]MCM1562168.1 polysaccharide biosynthesis protein [Clostridium sp.]